MRVSDQLQQTGLERVLFREHHEQQYEIEAIEGTVPAFVRGTYFLNGPARFARNGMRYRNWLDGDGMVCSLRFHNEGVSFQSRFVQTAKLRVEEETGSFQFRAFGTAFTDDRLKRGYSTESPANVSVFPFAGQLLAFGEQSIPYALDIDTLATVGVYDFHHTLNDISPFSAHPKIDAESGEMLNFGISYSANQPQLNYYRFDANGRLLLRHRIPLERATSLHDFTVSANYATFYLSPYCLDINRLVQCQSTTIDAMDWDGGDSKLLILNRRTGQEIWRLPIGKGYSLHTVNSFEADGYLCIDVLEMNAPLYESYQPLPQLFVNAPHGRPVRYEICLESGAVTRRQMPRLATIDFPCIRPLDQMLPYSQFWFLAISESTNDDFTFFNQLVAADWDSPESAEIYSAAPGCLLAAEPVFVADPLNQEKGVIICQEYCCDSDTSSFVVFDSKAIQDGPIARLILREPIHLGFHATFVHRRG